MFKGWINSSPQLTWSARLLALYLNNKFLDYFGNFLEFFDDKFLEPFEQPSKVYFGESHSVLIGTMAVHELFCPFPAFTVRRVLGVSIQHA